MADRSAPVPPVPASPEEPIEPQHTTEYHAALMDVWRGESGLLRHRYRRCGFSGSGNCCCGRAIESVLHPHAYKRMGSQPALCVCGKDAAHPAHQAVTRS